MIKRGKEIDRMPSEGELQTLVSWADEHHGGHLTIYRFTTGWKVLFGTSMDRRSDHRKVSEMPGYMGLDDAVRMANFTAVCAGNDDD